MTLNNIHDRILAGSMHSTSHIS